MSGDYQIRYQAGMLVLTKGDIRVLTVPLETSPRDVYLEGQGVILRQVALDHGGPAPEDPIAPPRVILQGDRPAELPWTACPSGRGSFQRLEDGSVELSVKEKTTLSTAVTMPLFRAGLYEVIFQLDRPSSDSGIFLADDQGRAIQGVEFYLDKTPGLVAARFGRPTDPAISSGNPPQDIPLGYTPQQPWWRLVLGAGTMRCFTSGDGLHWGQALATLPQGGNFLRIGLYCQPGSQPRRIGLRRLIVREIDALMALAPVELEERAEASPVTQRNEELTDLMVWQSQVLGSTPPGVDGAAWRRACGLATLVHGAETPLAKAILEKLLEEGLARPMSLPAKLRLLDQATLLWNTWTNEDAQRLVARWDRLGMALLREGGLQDLEDFRKARMTASFWTQDYRVEPFDEALARGCLVSLVCRSQWNEAERLCGQLRFWNQPADPGAGWPSTQNQVNALVNWINPLAENGEKHDPQSGARAEVLLRHPVSVPTSKEAFNLATDFRAAVDEEDYRQAFRVVTSATLSAELSLIPDPADPRRFESLTTTIRRMVRSHPQLKQVMNDSLTAMDHLRVSRALAEGDVPKVRNLSIQYYGTPAGAEALRWLGDQMLGAGEFARAISYFEQALPMASAAQEQQLAARLRLAGAMLGERVRDPATVPVRFGDLEMSAADFEKLVAEMLQEHGADRAKAGGGVASRPPADGQTPALAPGRAGTSSSRARSWRATGALRPAACPSVPARSTGRRGNWPFPSQAMPCSSPIASRWRLSTPPAARSAGFMDWARPKGRPTPGPWCPCAPSSSGSGCARECWARTDGPGSSAWNWHPGSCCGMFATRAKSCRTRWWSKAR